MSEINDRSEPTINSSNFDLLFLDPWDLPGDQGFLQSILWKCCYYIYISMRSMVEYGVLSNNRSVSYMQS